MSCLTRLAVYHTLVDPGEAPAMRFGPRSFFRTAIRYDDLQKVEVNWTTLLGAQAKNHGGRHCAAVYRG